MARKKDSENSKQSDLMVQIILFVIIVLISISIIYVAALVFKQLHKGDPLYMARSTYESNL